MTVVKIVTIVEGHGEVEAAPILIRRVATAERPEVYVDVPRPIRIPKHKLLKVGELERAVQLAARQSGDGDAILILLDADTDCPKELAPRLLDRARAERPDRTCVVVLAKMEFEAWFLAAAESIAGKRELAGDLTAPDNPEDIQDAKGWLSERMPRGRSYRETLDQPALAAVFSLGAAASLPSFGKLRRDILSVLHG